MSDFLKIVVFSLFLSILWVIPRFDLIIQWATHHFSLAIGIAVSMVGSIFLFNWSKRLVQKRMKV
ncbi:hypothetical protein [Halalkalibacter lacteus]|uniref:hypothetical protein n=1 Tax=Halalkalibacter lacteus TaxID=3090663 RepID=UPI002FC935DA